MRTFSIIGITTCSLLTTLVATAKPQPPTERPPPVTTQACLGDLNDFLRCPPGAAVDGTECRATSGHWAKSTRQGPALLLRDAAERDSTRVRVQFASFYKDHKKTGRTFHFDAEGRLEEWSDTQADEQHGLSVQCSPDGRVERVASFNRGKVVGLSRTWGNQDGTLSLAYEHGADGRGRRVEVSAELARRPDELCRPTHCDVTARPDLSGIPASQPSSK